MPQFIVSQPCYLQNYKEYIQYIAPFFNATIEIKYHGHNASKSTKLFKLQDITPVRMWDYKSPTLVQGRRFTSRIPWTQLEDFTNKFFASYPILKESEQSDQFGHW